jgi:hypothetical protein
LHVNAPISFAARADVVKNEAQPQGPQTDDRDDHEKDEDSKQCMVVLDSNQQFALTGTETKLFSKTSAHYRIPHSVAT